jgi:hypothetical protein
MQVICTIYVWRVYVKNKDETMTSMAKRFKRIFAANNCIFFSIKLFGNKDVRKRIKLPSDMSLAMMQKSFLFSGHEPIYFIENKEKTLRASYDRGT